MKNYEEEKKKIKEKNLSADEYERAIKEMCKRRKV
jgi:hypothetical protein